MNSTILLSINLILLVLLWTPLAIFMLWNWQYRHLQNGYGLIRRTTQHWVSGLFFLVSFLMIRYAAVTFGWEYPSAINRYVSMALFAYMILRTWTSLSTFKKVRDGKIKVGPDHP